MSLSTPTTSSTHTTTPNYRLTYFNAQGKAEVSRYLFKLANQPFIDERISKAGHPIDGLLTFDSVKSGLPFGQVPVLYVDGPSGTVVLCQSRAVERFLARRFGLMGSGDVEEQQVDSVVEAVRDLTQAYSVSRGDDSTKQHFLAHTLPTVLQQLERFVQRCSTSAAQDTLVGEKLSLADVALYQALTAKTPDQPAVAQVVDGYPRVKAAMAHVAGRPEIRAWLATRPC